VEKKRAVIVVLFYMFGKLIIGRPGKSGRKLASPHLTVEDIFPAYIKGFRIQFLPGVVAKHDTEGTPACTLVTVVRMNGLDEIGGVLDLYIATIVGQLYHIASLGIAMEMLIKEIYKLPPKHLSALIIPDAFLVDPYLTGGGLLLVRQILPRLPKDCSCCPTAG